MCPKEAGSAMVAFIGCQEVPCLALLPGGDRGVAHVRHVCLSQAPCYCMMLLTGSNEGAESMPLFGAELSLTSLILNRCWCSDL
jgi:hypothetical protein